MVEAYKKAREDLEARILDLENSISEFVNTMKQNSALYEKDDFGLDPKKQDEAKKIKQARAMFSGFFATEQAKVARKTKELDELDKHVIQLGKYKGPY